MKLKQLMNRHNFAMVIEMDMDKIPPEYRAMIEKNNSETKIMGIVLVLFIIGFLAMAFWFLVTYS